MKLEWVLCPVWGNKTYLKDTFLKNYYFAKM